jgi:hypothetical protein
MIKLKKELMQKLKKLNNNDYMREYMREYNKNNNEYLEKRR